MYIQTQKTPNPNTLKFMPGIRVAANSLNYQFNKYEHFKYSLLAKQLIDIEGVKYLFFGKDFISITKHNNMDWLQIKMYILSNVIDYLISGLPLINKFYIYGKINFTQANSTIEKKIINLLELKIRPVVANDGGDIIFNKYENGIVYLKLQGACKGCPSSSITLKQGIENMLIHYISEIKSVRSI